MGSEAPKFRRSGKGSPLAVRSENTADITERRPQSAIKNQNNNNNN